MFRSAVLLCVAFSVVIEARPKWQFLPAVPGYVPVYIQAGDTPLEQINPELAEAFHVLPSGRSASKVIDASPEEMADQPESSNEDSSSSEEKQVSSEEKPISINEEKPNSGEKTVSKQDILVSDESVDHRPYAKTILEKKRKVAEVAQPIERR